MACSGCERRRRRLSLWAINMRRRRQGLPPLSFEQAYPDEVAAGVSSPNAVRERLGLPSIPTFIEVSHAEGDRGR